MRELLAPGVAAVRRYWRPFVLIQMVALALVVGYFRVGPMRQVCQKLADAKVEWGYAFSALVGGISAGILPELFKGIALGDWHFNRQRTLDMAFNVVYFAILGALTDGFYRLNGALFGNDQSAGTIIKKVLFDQGVATPLVWVPIAALTFGWRSGTQSLGAVIGSIGPRWYLYRVVVLLLPCWAFWMPTVLLIYSLPAPLQFTLFALANAAWSILMIAVASRK